MSTTHKTTMDAAIDAWYQRDSPKNDARRAAVVAKEFGLDADDLLAACLDDQADHADGDI